MGFLSWGSEDKAFGSILLVISCLMMPYLTLLRQFVNESAVSFSIGEFSQGMRQ